MQSSRLAVAVFAAVSCVSPAASSYCRTMSEPVSANYVPAKGACWNKGVPLFWNNLCVGYSVQKDASTQISLADATSAVSRAFGSWESVECPAHISIKATNLGPVECHEVRYNSSGPNQNVIMFDDTSWPHSDSSNTLALTTVTFNSATGEIYDADIEINTFQQHLSTGDISKSGYDFDSIITHEVGHFLGLAHSPDTTATMFAHYTPGTISMRTLAPDDIAGICNVYPPAGTGSATSSTLVAPTCDPMPRHGFSSECAGSNSTRSGCALGPSRSGVSGLVAVLLGLCLGTLRRRSRGA